MNALVCRVIAAALSAASAGAALAQIAGNGLGTSVSQAGAAWTISAGTQVGGNLFHSFSSFSVPTANSATFTGPGSVQHVIGRVTGANASTIDGLLRNAIPGADLWLINPKGVTFGPNASLDVQGSVHISTADYLKLGSTGQFNATNPGASVLVSAPPSAFGFLGAPAAITVDHSTLATANGKGLSLVGGPLTLNGATLLSYGGELGLASIASGGEVQVAGMSASGISAYGAINASSATLDVSSGPMPSSGSIRIVGGQFSATDSTLRADNSGSVDGGGIQVQLAGSLQMTGGGIVSHAHAAGRSGDIDIQAAAVALDAGAEIVSGVFGPSRGADVRVSTPGSLLIDGESGGFPSGIFAVSYAGSTGPAGSIFIRSGSATLLGGGVVSVGTYGAGAGGQLSLDTDGPLSVRGESLAGEPSAVRAASEAGATGAGGAISVRAGSIELIDGGQILGGTFGAGNGGSVTVVTRGALRINAAGSTYNYSGVLAGTADHSSGNGGSISVTADSISVERDSDISADSFGRGNGGDVSVAARTINVSDNATISSVTYGRGTSGTTTVIASEAITLSGRFSGTSAGIYSQAQGRGDSGAIVVSAPQIRLEKDATINAVAFKAGNAGQVDVSGSAIVLVSGGHISSSTFGSGRAGDVSVNASRLLSASGHRGLSSGIFSDSINGGTGDAGKVSVRAGRLAISRSAEISSDTDAAGKGGNVAVSARDVVIRSGGDISASTYGPGKAGDISVDASGDLLVKGANPAGQRSGIYSAAVQGSGDAGSIAVRASGVTVREGATISASTYDSGDAGSLTVSARANVDLLAGGTVTSLTFGSGKAGNVTVAADGTLTVAGVGPSGFASGIFTNAQGTTGDAGNLSVAAGDARLLDSGTISSSTFSSGRGGDVRVSVAGSLLVSGKGAGGYSGIFATSSGSGDAGTVDISAGSMQLLDLGAVSSSTFGTGRGGNVQVSVNGGLLISGFAGDSSSGIFAVSQGSQSLDGGSVIINAGEVVVRDGATISASSSGAGAAGNVQVTAGRVRLINDGFIGTRAAVSDGGDISIQATDLVYLKDSAITTSVAGGAGNGGNITIDPQFVVLDNSQIIANAFGGNGGNIRIVSDNFLNQNGLVQASSQRGISGNVVIQSPRVDVSGALRVLNAEYLDASRLMRASCASRANQASSTFVAGMRGGVAAAPESGKELPDRRAVALGCAPLQGMVPVLHEPAAGDHYVAN